MRTTGSSLLSARSNGDGSRRSPACRRSPLTIVVALTAGRAWAVGETITDVRILGNQRTDEDTVRSIAGVKIGRPWSWTRWSWRANG